MGPRMPGPAAAALALLAALVLSPPSASAGSAAGPTADAAGPSILVAGSANSDTFLPVPRLPSPGENLTVPPGRVPRRGVPGGKGLNQAMAASCLSDGDVRTSFLGRLGDDDAGSALLSALEDAGVDASLVSRRPGSESGRGYVLVSPGGEVAAVVSGGANADGWSDLLDGDGGGGGGSAAEDAVRGRSLLMLQCEVPGSVNLRLAGAARAAGVPVLLDAGGEDRPACRETLSCCDFVVPNETELR